MADEDPPLNLPRTPPLPFDGAALAQSKRLAADVADYGRAAWQTPSRESPAAAVLTMVWARSAKTFDALRVLAGLGYGEQASMLARTLYEDTLERIGVPTIRPRRGTTSRITSGRPRTWSATNCAASKSRARRRHPQRRRPQASDRAVRHLARPQLHRPHARPLYEAVRDAWIRTDGDTGVFEQVHRVDHEFDNLLIHATALALSATLERDSQGYLEGFRAWPALDHVGGAYRTGVWSYLQTLSLGIGATAKPALDDLFVRWLRLYTNPRKQVASDVDAPTDNPQTGDASEPHDSICDTPGRPGHPLGKDPGCLEGRSAEVACCPVVRAQDLETDACNPA